jgi:lipopolysaccharide transport system ATP-binding protein
MLSDLAISADRLGKLYKLGGRFEPRLTLREQINRLALAPCHRLRAVLRGESAAISGEDFWALTDLSLSVSYGEVVGVIGRNGAGKSTLLKILSRITEPTTGRAEIRGRVASLLEVGTGFHSELTGRENIFLNGVILGMTRAEVSAKLDEIVAFADVERFLDTQVKHYSSGMSLRLAFAVAAHLQPEILLIDEVLAVGDAAFQRKCLGKMSDVARMGRAILFVSHNLEAVQRLCGRCVWIDGGRIRQEGSPESVIRAYLEDREQAGASYTATRKSAPDEPIVLQEAQILDDRGEPCDAISYGEPFSLRFRWDVARWLPGVVFNVHVFDSTERVIFVASTHGSELDVNTGTFETVCRVQENVLIPGHYSVSVSCGRPPRVSFQHVERCVRLRVLDVPFTGKTLPHLHRDALVAPEVEWAAKRPMHHAADAARRAAATGLEFRVS